MTNDVPALVEFYRDVIGFQVEYNSENNVEFTSEGVRFAVCDRSILETVTGHPSFKDARNGQAFELAFPLDTPEEVDAIYAQIIAKGAIPIKQPDDMPWGQRSAFFADPEGNIHEIFADLSAPQA